MPGLDLLSRWGCEHQHRNWVVLTEGGPSFGLIAEAVSVPAGQRGAILQENF